MKNSVWTHILGNTWCLVLHVTIPVFFLNSREVILLDTGYADLDRPALLVALQEKNVTVRAVLGSHSHNDHNGSHAYFQKHHGAEIILQETEAAIVSDFPLVTAAYAPDTAEELRRELPHPAYILAHRGVRTEIAELVDRNIQDKLRRADEIADWMREQGPMTQNDAECLLWNKLGLHSQRFFPQVIFRRNVQCALEYLVRSGAVRWEFRNGTQYYTA